VRAFCKIRAAAGGDTRTPFNDFQARGEGKAEILTTETLKLESNRQKRETTDQRQQTTGRRYTRIDLLRMAASDDDLRNLLQKIGLMGA
jgi:hypothetical protein